MEILESLGINGKILAAQVVNFFLLLWVLKRFLYNPLLRVMEKREKKIKKGLIRAHRVEERLKEIDEREEKRMEKAQEKAQEIIEEAHKEAEKEKAGIAKKAREEIEKWKNEAKEQIRREKDELKSEVKAETADLIISVVRKLVPRKMDPADERAWLEEIKKTLKSK